MKLGRPKGTTGTGPYGEPTRTVRIPESLYEKFKKWLVKETGVKK